MLRSHHRRGVYLETLVDMDQSVAITDAVHLKTRADPGYPKTEIIMDTEYSIAIAVAVMGYLENGQTWTNLIRYHCR